MTITLNPVRNEYTATASQDVFNYTFKIFANDELNVYITEVNATPNDVADLTTSYVVDPSTIGDEAGGFFTLNTPLSGGQSVVVASAIDYDREVDYQNNGDFRPATVNADNDRQVAQIKQVLEAANRTLRIPESSPLANFLTLPTPEAGRLLRWLGDLSGLENINLSQLSPDLVVSNDLLIQYDSIDAALAADNSAFSSLQAKSFRGGWAATIAGPKGGGVYHSDGLTGTPSTKYADLTGFFDSTGKGFSLDLNGREIYMFGAYGNGDGNGNGTDDTPAFQAAIDSLASWPTDTVFRPVTISFGTFRIASTLNIPRTATNTPFIGVARGVSRLDFTGVSLGINNQGEATDWSGLTFIGSSVTTIMHANNLNDAADIDVQFDICTFDGAGINVICEGRGARFFGCNINTYDTGVHLQIVAPVPFLPGPGFNQQERTGMRRYMVVGCTLDGIGSIVEVPGTTTADENVHGIVIVGNEGSGVRRIFRGTSIRNSIISGNTFLSSRGWAVPSAAEAPIQAKFIENLVLDGNTIRQGYDTSVEITGVTQAATAVVTAPDHEFVNGNLVFINFVKGMTNINRLEFTVANKTDNTFELSGINSTGFGAYTGGGQVELIESNRKVPEFVAVLNDPFDVSDVSSTTEVRVKGLKITDNSLEGIKNKVFFARCFVKDVDITENTFLKFGELGTGAAEFFEVIEQAKNCTISRNRAQINKILGTTAKLVNLGTNTDCTDVIAQGNEFDSPHDVFLAEPSGKSPVNGDQNWVPKLQIDGVDTGIVHDIQVGNFERLGKSTVSFNCFIALTSKGVQTGDVTISLDDLFTVSGIFDSSGANQSDSSGSGFINAYGNDIGGPNIQYIDIKAPNIIRLKLDNQAALQDTHLTDTFFIKLWGTYFTRH